MHDYMMVQGYELNVTDKILKNLKKINGNEI